MNRPASVLVCGDLILDHHVYEGSRPLADSASRNGVQVAAELGGAALVHRFIASALGKERVHVAFAQAKPDELPAWLHAYATWTACDAGIKPGKPTWRVSQPLGYGNGPFTPRVPFAACESMAPAEVVVIDDAGLGFRFWPDRAHWPIAPAPVTESPRWVVLKVSGPLAEGDLWRRLSDVEAPADARTCGGWLDRLVVIVTASSLRREGVNIGSGLSWEQSVEDLAVEIERHPIARELGRARHLIVTFGRDGAFWRENDPDRGTTHRCIFDRSNIEGDFERGIAGRVFGSHAVFTASIVCHLGAEASLEQGIKRGLQGMRRLLEHGHGPATEQPGWPLDIISHAILDGEPDLEVAEVPLDAAQVGLSGRDWMLCGLTRHRHPTREPLVGLATRIARFGVESMSQVPCVSFGKLTTADRSEIEALRQIRGLIQDYQQAKRVERPLSLAAFGPPGAGKSFGIKQIAQGVLGHDVAFLEFNLSQMANEADLVGALHQVRDKALEGRIPFVFWDEFDSGNYRWLRSFLAPMQDGKFLDGQISHAVGKCVFVFAGGTSSDWDHFGPAPGDATAQTRWKLDKGPDFRSRVAGVLNVLGPNPREVRTAGSTRSESNPNDICWPVRRAVLLRAWLGLRKGMRLKIDSGLLAALLETPLYTNGARSFERLVRYLVDQGGSALRIAHLPPREQLAMSTDADAFHTIIERFSSFRAAADAIAPAIHEGWTRIMAAQKGEPAPAQEGYLKRFEDLPAHMRADNVAAARRIVDALALVGLSVVPATETHDRSAQENKSVVASVIARHMELLAEQEHDGWMTSRVRNGWIPGDRDPNGDTARRHPLLRPYRELDEAEKDKDRNTVRLYPDFVEIAGYRIVARRSQI